jgi:hypothetical protein
MGARCFPFSTTEEAQVYPEAMWQKTGELLPWLA